MKQPTTCIQARKKGFVYSPFNQRVVTRYVVAIENTVSLLESAHRLPSADDQREAILEDDAKLQDIDSEEESENYQVQMLLLATLDVHKSSLFTNFRLLKTRICCVGRIARSGPRQYGEH
ncbi:unnamed protein product [Clavelina lepadiformis]|uniref:Uncharacterized protein n=1 Tax=Clavelina lepadiformis TaxID=159417 RepID=A0ABP0F450_CLALP